MTVDWKIKPFNTLTIDELYKLLQLRAEVFIVEQNSVYQDIDGKDQNALHIMGYADNKMVAYSRIFNAGFYFDKASIGRVIVAKEYRRHKIGNLLIQRAILGIKDYFKQDEITISAQYYLLNFYKSHGFEPVGEEYLEDNIPHIEMRISHF